MWNKITILPPPFNRVVEIKIDDGNGLRNQQHLKFDGKLWWLKDGSAYVYFKPTHWRY